jgi:hypothetical protein
MTIATRRNIPEDAILSEDLLIPNISSIQIWSSKMY